MRLAGRIDREGVTPSLVRELRYALLSLGVKDLQPYQALMAHTKSAIDRSDENLPTLVAQLREQEQTLQRLGGDPADAYAVRVVREAVDGLVALWASAWSEHVAGVERDWEASRVESARLWKIVNDAGGGAAFPDEVARADDAWDAYWHGRVLRRRGGVVNPFPGDGRVDLSWDTLPYRRTPRGRGWSG